MFTHSRLISGMPGGKIIMNGREIVTLGSNNYLGLAGHPQVIQAFKEAADKYGVGTGMNPPLASTEVHEQLRHLLATFHGTEDCIIFNSCTSANMGLLDTLGRTGDVIFSDELNHASIIDGCRLSRAETVRYPHRNYEKLASLLEATEVAPGRKRIVVTDGVFSMEGYCADLSILRQLCDSHGALLVVDESHGAGAVGATGRGAAEVYTLVGKVDYITGTLSKAFGAAGGGYVCASEAAVRDLIENARMGIFSASINPASAAAAATAISLTMTDEHLLDSLRGNSEYFRNGVEKLGLRIIRGQSSITPIMIGDETKAASISAALLENGVFAPAISYPVVPKGTARLRAQPAAPHSQLDLDFAIQTLHNVTKSISIQ
jgi:glycine C-acetyltransferase